MIKLGTLLSEELKKMKVGLTTSNNMQPVCEKLT